MRRISYLCVILILAALTLSAVAAPYEITREPDGPFNFKILGIELNKGSSLVRETILFNDPTCPVQLSKNSMTFNYADRRLSISSATVASVKQPIVAMEVRHIMFDVFGQHMKNLSNTEVLDIGSLPIPTSLKATWNLFDENDASEFLTSVTYVARVRLVDGTQWVVNADNLSQALGTLKLERKIEDDKPSDGKP
jgi:hypothetical protein